jgi:hypothetical protein
MKCLSCVFIVLFAVTLTHAQSATEKVGSAQRLPPNLSCSPAPCRLPNTRVTPGNRISPTAPNLAINQNNPMQMIVGEGDGACTSGGAAYASSDGGTTWTKTCLPVLSTLDGYTQLWMVYDNSGVVHALLGTSNADCGENLILESHSSDNGATWSSLNQLSAVIFQVLDSQAIDNNANSPFAGNIYGSVTQFLFNVTRIAVWRSSDGGATWSPSTAAILPNTSFFDGEGYSHLEVGKDGTVYLAYMASSSGGSAPNEMMFTKSIDGGQTWSSPVQVYSATPVSDLPNTAIYVANAPIIAVDDSPAGKSRLYMTFYNWTGSFMQVLVTSSGDGGNTWSVPVPVAPASTAGDQLKPYVSVSATGSVAVTWLDRRDDPSNVNYRPYLAITRNGLFSKNVPLANASSAPVSGLSFNASPAANAWSGSTLFAIWPDTRQSGKLQQLIGGYKQQ